MVVSQCSSHHATVGVDVADRPGVPLAFELSDLRYNDAAALAADVPTVELAVELVADGDVAVPAAVGALVDRRLAVRGTSRHRSPLGRGWRLSLAERSAAGRGPVESRRVWGLRAELEEFPLVRAGPGPSRRTGSFQAVDVALELGPGEAAAAADVHRVQLPGLH